MNVDIGYFALKTASAYNNFHYEEICFDPEFMEDVVSKCIVIFKHVIVPELITGAVRKSLEHSEIDNSVNQMSNCEVVDTPPQFFEAEAVSSAAEYVCKVCSKECIDGPKFFSQMSIFCDYCNNWFHWKCVHVKGTEKFLKKKSLKWKCPICSKN
jgi:hypothetical protein